MDEREQRQEWQSFVDTFDVETGERIGDMMAVMVRTFRLGTSYEVLDDVWAAVKNDRVIGDQTARTLADWWQSPHPRDASLVALAQGTPFLISELREAVGRIPDMEQRNAMIVWIEGLDLKLRRLAKDEGWSYEPE